MSQTYLFHTYVISNHRTGGTGPFTYLPGRSAVALVAGRTRRFQPRSASGGPGAEGGLRRPAQLGRGTPPAPSLARPTRGLVHGTMRPPPTPGLTARSWGTAPLMALTVPLRQARAGSAGPGSDPAVSPSPGPAASSSKSRFPTGEAAASAIPAGQRRRRRPSAPAAAAARGTEKLLHRAGPEHRPPPPRRAPRARPGPTRPRAGRAGPGGLRGRREARSGGGAGGLVGETRRCEGPVGGTEQESRSLGTAGTGTRHSERPAGGTARRRGRRVGRRARALPSQNRSRPPSPKPGIIAEMKEF